VAAAGCVLAALTTALYQLGPAFGGWAPGCLLHRLTGFWCAGCGMTRAVWHLLHCEPVAALRQNPLLVVLLPLVVAGLALELTAWVRSPQRPTPRLRLDWRVSTALAGVLLAYGIVRNFPWWPCTLLAPQ
jgi:hypothetical protein